jgi:hypothetical protein
LTNRHLRLSTRIALTVFATLFATILFSNAALATEYKTSPEIYKADVNENFSDIPVLNISAYNSPDIISADYVCDGIDDQEEINSAISSLNDKAGIISLSKGLFNISKPILTRNYLILSGQGYETLINLVDEGNCDIISSADGPYNQITNLTILNLRINGNKKNQFILNTQKYEWKDGHGIFLTCSNSTFKNLWIEDIYNRGITCRSGYNNKIMNCILINCNRVGISYSEVNVGEIVDNDIINCGSSSVSLPLKNNDGSAIAIYMGENIKILSNRIEEGGFVRQIVTYNSKYVEITNNYLLNGLLHGIGCESQYAKIFGNTVKGCKGNGIDTWGAEDIWIENNFVSHIGGVVPEGFNDEDTGICMNTSRSSAINNTIEFCYAAGIHIGPGNNNNRIIGNIIRNCGINNNWSSAGIWVQSYIMSKDIKNLNIENNTIYDNQQVKTQWYGISLSTKPNCYIKDIFIEDNDLKNNKMGGIYDFSKNLINLQMSKNTE